MENMNDIFYMQEAIKEAKKAYKIGEVPVGCVIVVNDEIVAKSHNLRHTFKNGLYHAEMIAISRACKKLSRWILDDATIYITLEPCLMCSGAIIQSRIKRLVYGTKEPKFGCAGSIIDVFSNNDFNHQVEVSDGILKEEISQMMKDFFVELRNSKKI